MLPGERCSIRRRSYQGDGSGGFTHRYVHIAFERVNLSLKSLTIRERTRETEQSGGKSIKRISHVGYVRSAADVEKDDRIVRLNADGTDDRTFEVLTRRVPQQTMRCKAELELEEIQEGD